MTVPLVQHSAGGIVYRRNGNHYEVAMIKDSYDRWTFPKGHTEPNETLEETAKREISEEIGIEMSKLHTKCELGEMDYWFNSTYKSDLEASRHKSDDSTKSVLIHKYVTYFLFETDRDTEILPQEGEVAAAEWVSLAEMNSRNEYEDNRALISRAIHYLRAIGALV